MVKNEVDGGGLEVTSWYINSFDFGEWTLSQTQRVYDVG